MAINARATLVKTLAGYCDSSRAGRAARVRVRAAALASATAGRTLDHVQAPPHRHWIASCAGTAPWKCRMHPHHGGVSSPRGAAFCHGSARI
jgi:hypothetical protein